MSKYFPPYNSSEKIKVELDLSNYATKDDVKNITHVEVSGFASKTNLAALKTEVDKIDTDKLKTVPDDLAKLSNAVKNEAVKKTDYNTLKSKVDDIDISTLVTKINFTASTNVLDDKMDKVEKKVPVLTDFVRTAHFNHEKNLLATKTALKNVENKMPDISNLATKTSLSPLLPVRTFNSKVMELDGKVTTADNRFSGFVKKADYGNEITKIKNDYATNASLDSKLNDLKAQHISTEVKKINEKTKKNASDILKFESRLKQKEDIVDDVQRENTLTSGRDYYRDEMYLLYECRAFSFKYTNNKINLWKSTGLNNYTSNSDMDAVSRGTKDLPSLVDYGRMSVKLDGAYFKQTKLIRSNNNNVINIYIVYKIEPIFRVSDYTVQNALFGGKYKEYGICFDEVGTFSKGGINNGRNVSIFGVHESCLVYANNNGRSFRARY